jgi:hypothetical protein
MTAGNGQPKATKTLTYTSKDDDSSLLAAHSKANALSGYSHFAHLGFPKKEGASHSFCDASEGDL